MSSSVPEFRTIRIKTPHDGGSYSRPSSVYSGEHEHDVEDYRCKLDDIVDALAKDGWIPWHHRYTDESHTFCILHLVRYRQIEWEYSDYIGPIQPEALIERLNEGWDYVTRVVNRGVETHLFRRPKSV